MGAFMPITNSIIITNITELTNIINSNIIQTNFITEIITNTTTSLGDPTLWITFFGAFFTAITAGIMLRSVNEMKKQYVEQNRPKLSIFSKDIFVEKGEVEDNLIIEILNYSNVPAYNIMLDTEPKFYNNYLPRILGLGTLNEFEWHSNSLHPQQKTTINMGRFPAVGSFRGVYGEGCVHGDIKECNFILTYFDSQDNKYEDVVLLTLPIDNYEVEYFQQEKEYNTK